MLPALKIYEDNIWKDSGHTKYEMEFKQQLSRVRYIIKFRLISFEFSQKYFQDHFTPKHYKTGEYLYSSHINNTLLSGNNLSGRLKCKAYKRTVYI